MNVDPSKDQPVSSGKVLDLGSFRKKKETKDEFARGREPLFSSHLETPPSRQAGKRDAKKQDADFGDRLNRIRSSLEKINRLMGELKKMSAMSTTEAERTPRPLN